MKTFEYTLKQYKNDDETKKVAYKNYVEINWGKWDEEQQKEMFINFIDTYGKDIKIVMEKNKRIGFYHGENLENGGYEIGNICIIPECQGRGIGTKILNDILEEHKHQDIYLRYFKQNPVVKLYERLGFEMLEEMPFHFKMVKKANIIQKEKMNN